MNQPVPIRPEGDQPRVVRSAVEIQICHDLLTNLIGIIAADQLGPALKELLADPDAKVALMANADTLCWLLGHDHNDTFPNNMAALRVALEQDGIEVVDFGRLVKP